MKSVRILQVKYLDHRAAVMVREAGWGKGSEI